jgi:hypothetical protein
VKKPAEQLVKQIRRATRRQFSADTQPVVPKTLTTDTVRRQRL